ASASARTPSGYGAEARDPAAPQAPQASHLRPRAQRVVLLFQHGGPSHLDLFDPKPELEKYAGQPFPGGGVEAFFNKEDSGKCLPSPFRFGRHGESGMAFSELLPNLATCADDLCQVRSLHTEFSDHEGAIRLFQTGKGRVGRPSLGSWINYALGTENQRLPGHVALADPTGYQLDGIKNWTSGWLPAIYQGTPLRAEGTPLFNLDVPSGMTAATRRAQLDLLTAFNADHRDRFPHLSELDARIANLDLAASIKDAVLEGMDVSGETAATQTLYGMDNDATKRYGARCLIARRLLERGVRYVAVFNDLIMGDPWDTHFKHNERTRTIATNIDRPTAGLVADLKQRGLLEDTLVVWCGEFGRLPVAQGADGRDHNRHAFTALLAGGGIRPGLTYGATDDFGYKIAENPLTINDLHATLLRLLGVDHEQLTFRHAGRDESLTDTVVTQAQVVDALIDA
ncbi:MAG: DUF1501 domain-containing protein, partial [Planctomycetaceae bacterium]|nr:DUF1501 domain-containing protein [Planctomycetaceae bacterium]